MDTSEDLRYPIGPQPALEGPITAAEREEWIWTYIRFKLALTEDHPTIKPYDEAAWAELADSRTTEPEIALSFLDALHARWAGLLRAMPDAAYRRTFHHPESGRTFTLEHVLGHYAWHSHHHLRHITALCERNSWA